MSDPLYPPEAIPNDPPAPNPPQSPSGTSQPAPNRGELITESFLSGIGPNIPQQGTAAISDVSTITIAGVAPGALQVNNWTSGSVGVAGDKFS